MTPEQMRVLEEDAADAIVEAIDNGGRLRMTIPAEPERDTDLRVAAALVALRAAADQLEAVRMKAGIHAVAAHALGRSDQERDWLDILAIIPPDTAPQEVTS